MEAALLKELALDLLGQLSVSFNKRAVGVISKRYGLNAKAETFSLEEIGKQYGGLTRERIRQIEATSIGKIKSFFRNKAHIKVINDLKSFFEKRNFLLSEPVLFDELCTKKIERNYLIFILDMHDEFTFIEGNSVHKDCWTTDVSKAEKVLAALGKISLLLDDEDVIPQEKLLQLFYSLLRLPMFLGENIKLTNTTLLEWLVLSNVIGKNHVNEWGKITSPYITQKGLSDWAVYVMKKAKIPMHFNDIAKEIELERKTRVNNASCHNALIIDDRIALVGRGMYALKEWGYQEGFIVDAIKEVLSESGPLQKKDLIKAVLEKKKVKENSVTAIIGNHSDLFTKDPRGFFSLKQVKTE